MSERIDDAAARLLGISRASGTEKGLAKDIRRVLDALTVAQGKAVLSQPTPTAEPPTIVTGMRVRYIDGGVERIVGEFTDGAWDLVIPGTEKSRMSVEPEVFWQTVEPVPAPPSIADMVPGTTFTADLRGERDIFFRCRDSLARAGRYLVSMDAVDPSTIRDVTPPTSN